MDREKQFEEIEDLSTWYDEIMNNYEAAFWIHHIMLNNEIELWLDTVKINEDTRVKCFAHTEYMSLVYTELLLTIEVLLKGELVKTGMTSPIKTHKITDLLDMMMNSNDSRCIQIAKMFEKFKSLFAMTDNMNYFINLRYVDYDKVLLESDSVDEIKKLIIVIDSIYDNYYNDFSIIRLLYLGMEYDDVEIDKIPEEDRKRIKKVRVIKEENYENEN